MIWVKASGSFRSGCVDADAFEYLAPELANADVALLECRAHRISAWSEVGATQPRCTDLLHGDTNCSNLRCNNALRGARAQA
ncbi:hypothetical protein XI05_37990 [Bradyrhizobium sp. CCBAU 11357]|nr:hypothetical protein [Bradyrhizobium sp. CCBAU 11357]